MASERKPVMVPAAEVRRLVADYMRSEGCSCCRDHDAHRAHTDALGKLLRVPKTKGWHGYRSKCDGKDRRDC